MEYPPCHGDLVDKAMTYLKQNRKTEYRKMTVQQRNEYAESLAKSTERLAGNLIRQGVFESEAWNLAIRQNILGSETD